MQYYIKEHSLIQLIHKIKKLYLQLVILSSYRIITLLREVLLNHQCTSRIQHLF